MAEATSEETVAEEPTEADVLAEAAAAESLEAASGLPVDELANPWRSPSTALRCGWRTASC